MLDVGFGALNLGVHYGQGLKLSTERVEGAPKHFGCDKYKPLAEDQSTQRTTSS